MGKVLASLAAVYEGQSDAPVLLGGNGKDQVHLLVVATGERGLAGGFNSSIARLARDHANKLLAQGKTVKFLTVGRKGHDILKRQFADKIIETISYREVKAIGFAQANEVSQKVQALFAAGEFDVATLFYAKFNSVMSQEPTALQIIPAKIEAVAGAGEAAASTVPYEYEPSEEAIVEDLLPRNVSVQIFRAMLENGASFYGAQMSAMDNATRNAGEMIGQLQLSYNRQRQAQITKELIEIISGAEAL
jgi:F-type H+-transporting ATPase subunit gamma